MRRTPAWLERACWIVAVTALGWYGVTVAERWWYQTLAAPAMGTEAERPGLMRPAPAAIEPAVLTGRLDIPRLNVSARIRPGTDDRTLRLAVGHIEGTAGPDDPAGNVGLAAHRDTFFRPLRQIRVGDDIRLTNAGQTYAYRVIDTHIVKPGDVWVLDTADRARLTLVTCYPFDYIGRAPMRFIVHAEAISARMETD